MTTTDHNEVSSHSHFETPLVPALREQRSFLPRIIEHRTLLDIPLSEQFRLRNNSACGRRHSAVGRSNSACGRSRPTAELQQRGRCSSQQSVGIGILSGSRSENQPVLTRYLYERLHVKYSLQCALVEKKREEALYWAYELYHSGFSEMVWQWVCELYERYYEDYNPRFSPQLDRMYLQWKETGDDCILGTAVGTLAIRDTKDLGKGKREKFIVLYKEDRHKTQAVQGKARTYLKQVSQYPIRQQSKYMAESVDGLVSSKVREAYLGENWLYYCSGSPVWASRILEGGGVVDDLGKRVAFKSDDDLEAFYERWGLEPDEQCAEMHKWHGVDLG